MCVYIERERENVCGFIYIYIERERMYVCVDIERECIYIERERVFVYIIYI